MVTNSQEFNTLIKLLHDFDDTLSQFATKKEEIEEKHKKDRDGGEAYNEEVIAVSKEINTKINEIIKTIGEKTKEIRDAQPGLESLEKQHINISGDYPTSIAQGKLIVKYGSQFDNRIPRTFNFPFEKPLYTVDRDRFELLHKLILRLLFALPLDKQEYYIFDPIGLGKSIGKFNKIFTCEKLFPQQKILTRTDEFKSAMRDVKDYILSLRTKVFDLETQDWSSYNDKMCLLGKPEKMLPYKIFFIADVPEGMDSEAFSMFKTLINHGKQCGLMVLFSFNKDIFSRPDDRLSMVDKELLECIRMSEPLLKIDETKKEDNDDEDSDDYYDADDNNNGDGLENYQSRRRRKKEVSNVPAKPSDEDTYKNLKITKIGEQFPDDNKLDELLDYVRETANKLAIQSMSFDELMATDNLFGNDSRKELVIPVGSATSGNILEVEIGDETPHFLIGGTTGSGKSNFLHNVIMSACCRYSPEELRIYLLDFKEGVEFTRYAEPILPHAALVATEADTEYGVTVLNHLVAEKERRYGLFKSVGCKDIKEYRNKDENNIMPRILVVIDEFQVLFGNAQKEQTIATLEMLAKQGRACGIHLCLATQSLKGFDGFTTIGTQFGGRIALKCSAEDSKMLLGGITSNNEAAAELKIPFAILNTEQGFVSGNKKFMVPEAKSDAITAGIEAIRAKCQADNIQVADTKVFSGTVWPKYTGHTASRDSVTLHLGQILSYEAKDFELRLQPREDNNVLICGHNDKVRERLLYSVVHSAGASKLIDEIVYVGLTPPQVSGANVTHVENIRDFIAKYRDNLYGKKRLVILDSCNLTKIGFSEYMSEPSPGSDAAVLLGYLTDANTHGSYIVAVYNGDSKLKTCGLHKKYFNYVLGYALNETEINNIVAGGRGFSAPNDRVFMADNQEVAYWFRPFDD